MNKRIFGWRDGLRQKEMTERGGRQLKIYNMISSLSWAND